MLPQNWQEMLSAGLAMMREFPLVGFFAFLLVLDLAFFLAVALIRALRR